MVGDMTELQKRVVRGASIVTAATGGEGFDMYSVERLIGHGHDFEKIGGC